jgi:PAS domain S-box-containing protein
MEMNLRRDAASPVMEKKSPVSNAGREHSGRTFLTAMLICLLSPLLLLTAEFLFNPTAFSLEEIFSFRSEGLVHWMLLLAFASVGVLLTRLQKKSSGLKKANDAIHTQSGEEMNRMISFLADVQQGDFSRSYQFENDHLTQLLQSLKQKLSDQKEEDRRATWTAEGLSQFAELLRQSTDLDQLADEFIKQAVKYVGLNQGSLFLREQNEKEETLLVLHACYAYDRKKFLEKKIPAGEGLVGQCFLENETMLLKQVPAHYVKITSGLGEATPRFLVLVPIKNNDTTEGILEIAGFRELPSYQVHFLEKICEALASVVHSVKSNQETKKLLEASRKQTQQLQSQEEEIRQNLEEMVATQEELTRQLEENKLVRERVERREHVMALTTILSETDLHGTITFVNNKFCEVSQYTADELIGKPHNIVRHPDMPKELFALFWKTIKKGEVFRGIVKNRAKDGSAYWVDATIVPVIDHDGHIIKYTGARYHITDEDLAVKLYNRQAEKFGWPLLACESEEEVHRLQA